MSGPTVPLPTAVAELPARSAAPEVGGEVGRVQVSSLRLRYRPALSDRAERREGKESGSLWKHPAVVPPGPRPVPVYACTSLVTLCARHLVQCFFLLEILLDGNQHGHKARNERKVRIMCVYIYIKYL